MAEGFVNLTGADQLLKRLKAVEETMQRTVARRAARKGAIVFRDAARANYQSLHLDDPKTSENIARNIAVQQSRRGGAREGGVMMRVGIMGGARKAKGTGAPGGDTFYWRFLEFGAPGRKIQPRPFMRPVLSQKAQQATDAVADDLARSLDKLGA